jgi:hypothetical protein
MNEQKVSSLGTLENRCGNVIPSCRDLVDVGMDDIGASHFLLSSQSCPITEQEDLPNHETSETGLHDAGTYWIGV